MPVCSSDVIVIGGGPAGVTAAITAARQGNRVILITNRPVLGGNSSSEIRVWCRGATGGGNLFSEEMGVWGELKLRNLYANPEGNPIFWDEVLLDKVLAEPNIALYLNTHIISVDSDDRRINAISGFQLFTEKEITFSAEYFIDATGDAYLGARTGLDYYVGNSSKAEYEQEQHRNNNLLGSSILYYTKKMDVPVRYVKPDYAFELEKVEELINRGGRLVNENYSGSDYWWFEYGGTIDTITDSQKITIELKKLIYGIWNYIKNSGKYKADHLTLEWVGSIPGKRESRRMLTEYTITQDDILSHRRFFDGAFYGGWHIDSHPAEGINSEENACQQIPVNIYDIPLRCLFNREIENLLFAGRTIGASRPVFESSRIMNTCALSGQAAGTLASFCIFHQSTPLAAVEKNAETIRQTLLKDDMFVIGSRNSDELDLARKAEIRSSSTVSDDVYQESKQIPLDSRIYLTFPSRANTKICLTAAIDSQVHVCAYKSDVPSRLVMGEMIAEFDLSVLQGKHWYSVMNSIDAEQTFITLRIDPCEGTSIAAADAQLTGFIGWFENQANYWYPVIQADTEKLYDATKIINGYNRIYQEPNSWISRQEEHPAIFLKWLEKQKISSILLYFNTGLSNELPSSKTSIWAESHKYIPQNEMPEQFVRGFEIYTREDSRFVLIHQEKNNLRRLCTVNLPQTVLTDEIKIVISETFGAAYGEIFEIRVYS